MYEVDYTNQYKKDYKLCMKRKYDIPLLDDLLTALAKTGTVPAINKPHTLSGKLQGYWECHVKSDWLLIWLKNEDQKTITLIGTGTHSDLF
jgi:mRNA interferase YafQ